jgi:hypothetical protein
MKRGRAVLWGKRRGDWQVGGGYDRSVTRLMDNAMILRFTIRDELGPTIRKTMRDMERLLAEFGCRP